MGALPIAQPTRSPYRSRFWRTLWTNAIVAPKTTLGFMRIDFILGEIFVIPLTQMVFFVFVVAFSYADQPSSVIAYQIAYVAIGNAVATVAYASIFSVCQTTDSEKQLGTMEHLLVSPANRTALYFGRGFLPILISIGSVTIGLVYAVLFFGVTISAASAPFVAVSVVLTAFSRVGFGLLLGGVALYLRTSVLLGNIFLFIGLLLSGVNVPLSSLPYPVQIASYGLPLTWGVDAIRSAIGGTNLAGMEILWLGLALSGLAAYGLSIALWGTFEHRAVST
ncbi:MAG: ABC transporter permease, partial [Thermoplasmata archaeon]